MPARTRVALDIGPPRDGDEALLFADTVVHSLMGTAPPDQAAWSTAWLERTGTENVRVARRNGRFAGGLVLLRMGQFFGGRSVPMTGISAVAIRPEHRAGGVGSALMLRALEEMRAEGTALSGLFPATQPIYRRVGYEIAGTRLLYRIDTRSLALKSRPLVVRPVGPQDLARMRRVYTDFARNGSGLLDRIEWSWQRVLSAPDRAVHAHVAERGGEIEGYLVHIHEPLRPVRFDIIVRDFVALTRDAATTLLSFLGDHRSMVPSVLLFGSPADPLLLLLPEQDWKTETRWDWMLRVVDVERAFTARGWPPGLTADLHLDVTDETLPANAGRWRVRIEGGRAEAAPGGRGRVRIDVRGLASLYSGWTSAHALARAGLLVGTERDLATLSPAFAGPPPWMPDMY